MISFGEILEKMAEESNLDNNINSNVIGAIRAGVNLRPDFWDDFSKLCNQPATLSELLGVRKEIIASWPALIQRNLEQVKRLDGHDAQNKKANMIKTGF